MLPLRVLFACFLWNARDFSSSAQEKNKVFLSEIRHILARPLSLEAFKEVCLQRIPEIFSEEQKDTIQNSLKEILLVEKNADRIDAVPESVQEQFNCFLGLFFDRMYACVRTCSPDENPFSLGGAQHFSALLEETGTYFPTGLMTELKPFLQNFLTETYMQKSKDPSQGSGLLVCHSKPLGYPETEREYRACSR